MWKYLSIFIYEQVSTSLFKSRNNLYKIEESNKQLHSALNKGRLNRVCSWGKLRQMCLPSVCRTKKKKKLLT